MPQHRLNRQEDTAATTEPVASRLQKILDVVDYQLQAVVDIGTGVVFGYQAQVNNMGLAGAWTLEDLLDHAHDAGLLPWLETCLFRLALEKFSGMRTAQGTKLFFQLDGRGLGQINDPRLSFPDIVEDADLQSDQICLEVSGRHDKTVSDLSQHAINTLRQTGFLMALDDFGRGSSELRLLHDMSPDYVILDRAFLKGIESDPRRRLFASTVANLAHVMGARIIGEGIESEEELKAYRNAGCELVQGTFIAEPIKKPRDAKLFYDHVRVVTIGPDRRQENNTIRNELLKLPTIDLNTCMNDALEVVVNNQEANVIPVLDTNLEPRGLIHESDLKAYLYAGGPDSEDAKAALDFPMRSFVRACPIADINSNADTLLETVAHSVNSDGLIITENFRYAGFLSATSLLKIIHEKRLQEAQDQNPLTRLPGNLSITEYIAKASSKKEHTRHLCYLDFDNFKPFNDTYGFRQGDRAIRLFGELLQRQISGSGTFHAHLGGDDFFTGFVDTDQTDAATRILSLTRAFRIDMESFYSQEHRDQGYIEAADRFGVIRQFPLLQISVSILTLPEGLSVHPGEISRAFMDLKRAAKKSDDGLAVKTLEA